MKNNSFNKSVSENYNEVDLAIAGGLGFEIFKAFNLETNIHLGYHKLYKMKTFLAHIKIEHFKLT